MNLKKLSDVELRQSIHQLVKREREIATEILAHLCEVDRRKVFVDYGYETLFAYTRRELGYSDAEAQLRIEAMRMMRDISVANAGRIQSALSNGELNLTHLAQVKRASRRDRLPVEKSIELLNQITGLSTRESEVQIARECQRAIPRRKLTLDLSDEQYSLWMKARAEMLHHGNTPELIFQALCELGIEKGRGGLVPAPQADLSQQNSDATPQQARVNKTPPSSRLRPINPNRRTVSVAHRKQLTQKHCEYPGCTSRMGLQIDHKKPWSMGGKTSHENLQVYCVNHHARKSFRESAK